MTGNVRLFKIEKETCRSEAVSEVDFAKLGFQERRDIQEWVVANPGILGEDLLVIGKEFSGFDKTNERPDVLAVDRDGNVVVIELKRDDTGVDVHWQAIKYASYFHHAKVEDIIRMLAEYSQITESEADGKLKQRLNADDLDLLNHDQRIILVSHRFAPEVTSAVLWLNEKALQEDLITCIQLTPFWDRDTGSMYIQASTIIPVPGSEDLTIRIGPNNGNSRIATVGGPVKKEDVITRFMRAIVSNALDRLGPNIRPDKQSRWAGVGGDHRYYHVWYSRPPWSNWGMSYQLMLFPTDESSKLNIIVAFKCQKDILSKGEEFTGDDIARLKISLERSELIVGTRIREDDRWLQFEVTRSGNSQDIELSESVSSTLFDMIMAVTPVVKEVETARNEQ